MKCTLQIMEAQTCIIFIIINIIKFIIFIYIILIYDNIIIKYYYIIYRLLSLYISKTAKYL